jgi:hypothetical protein
MQPQPPQPPKAPLSNWIKWVAVLGLGALIGLGDVFTDKTFPGWWDVIRHAGGGLVTASVGLMTRLNS